MVYNRTFVKALLKVGIYDRHGHIPIHILELDIIISKPRRNKKTAKSITTN